MSRNLENVKSLLHRALNAAMDSAHNSTVKEATSHIKQAIHKIDKASNNQEKKKANATQFETWWGNVQAGTANQATSPMSAEVQQKKLADLNNMIAKEQNKLDALQKAADSANLVSDQLLQD